MNEQKMEKEELEELRQSLEKRTAQLEAMTSELEKFSYSVSHDLRAPLRAIEGFSKILLEDYTDKLDEEGQRFLKIIDGSSRKMTDLLDDLLLFSRLSRQEMNPARVDMGKAVQSAWEELRPDPGVRKVELNIDPLPDSWGDPALVQQVLKQLLGNAIKFTAPKTKAVIEVNGTKEPDRVVYRIKDNGVGFQMKSVSKLFGVFQRLHMPEEFDGNGIGLAIVQRLIRRQSGEVWAEAEADVGATFCFSLPATKNGK
ncbi:MAG: ATP-binding protein [Verrucomicrobiota bacterium]